MNELVTWMIIGLGAGLILLPILIYFFNLIRNTFERRKIKRMIKDGQFLKTIDPKDYDQTTWKNEITPESKEEIENRFNQMFINSAKRHVNELRESGKSDQTIREEMIIKNYPTKLIDIALN